MLAVVGVGALGSEVCRILAKAGQVRAVLIDPDRVEAKNLAHSAMLRLGYDVPAADEPVPPHKVTVVARAAERTFGQRGWVILPMEISDVERSILAECALILSCTDSSLARCETSWTARLLGKEVVDGGLKSEVERHGRVSLFAARRESACYLCQMSEVRRAEILQYAMAPSLGCMAQPVIVPMDASTSMISLTAERMVDTGMRILSKQHAHGEEQSIDGMESRAWLYETNESAIGCDEILLTRSSTCPWHEGVAEEHFVLAQPKETIACLLREAALRDELHRRMVVDLQWPRCLRARCTQCGAEQRVAQRLGLMRRRGVCAFCGMPQRLDAIEVVRTIGEDSTYRENKLEELGFSTEQIFCVRPEFQ
jgi:molybdopterin/thiamine biosynthesis adenylyltransferase